MSSLLDLASDCWMMITEWLLGEDIATLWLCGSPLLNARLAHGVAKFEHELSSVSRQLFWPPLLASLTRVRCVRLTMNYYLDHVVLPSFDWSLLPSSVVELRLACSTALTVQLPALEHLSFVWHSETGKSPDFPNFSKLTPNLKTLEWCLTKKKSDLRKGLLVLSRLPSTLTSLSVSVIKIVPSNSRGKTEYKWPAELRVCKIESIEVSIEVVTSLPPSLSCLELTSRKFDRANVDWRFGHLPKLESLLITTTTPTEEDILKLPRALTSLDLSFGSDVPTTDMLRALPPTLTYFNFGNNYLDVTTADKALELPRSLTSLHNLLVVLPFPIMTVVGGMQLPLPNQGIAAPLSSNQSPEAIYSSLPPGLTSLTTSSLQESCLRLAPSPSSSATSQAWVAPILDLTLNTWNVDLTNLQFMPQNLRFLTVQRITRALLDVLPSTLTSLVCTSPTTMSEYSMDGEELFERLPRSLRRLEIQCDPKRSSIHRKLPLTTRSSLAASLPPLLTSLHLECCVMNNLAWFEAASPHLKTLKMIRCLRMTPACLAPLHDSSLQELIITLADRTYAGKLGQFIPMLPKKLIFLKLDFAISAMPYAGDRLILPSELALLPRSLALFHCNVPADLDTSSLPPFLNCSSYVLHTDPTSTKQV